MKKLALILTFLCAWTVTVTATDVTMTSATIPNFNATGLSGSVTISNVSVSNGFNILSCSACFRSQWVGMSGFRITVQGTAYTVQNVASTSVVYLTANYTGSSTGAASVVWYPYVELRFYSNIAFQPLGASYVVQPGTPGSSSWYKRVAASIVNVSGVNTLYIPEMTLAATTDSPGPSNQARYTAGFYRPDGSLVSYYSCFNNFAVPTTTPTTWTALCAYNSPAAIVPPTNEAYTKPQIDARFPSCTADQMMYYAATGNTLSCLTVGAGLSISGSTITTTGGGGGSVTGSGTANQVAYWSSSSAITGGVNLYFNPVDIRLGVGTSSPSTAIHAATTAGNVATILADSAGTVTTAIRADDTNTVGGVGTTSNHTLQFFANNTAAMYLTAAGLFGVGKTSPNAKLHVDTGSNSVVGAILDVTGNFGDADAFRLRNGATTLLTIGNVGRVTFNPQAATSGSGASAAYFRIIGAADVGLTASTESYGIQFGGDSAGAEVTRTFAAGAKSTQSEYVFTQPRYAAASSTTTSDAATVMITGAPSSGTNMTITRKYGLWVQSGLARFNDGILVGETDARLARAAASVIAIGGNYAGSIGGTLSAVADSPTELTASQNDYTAGGARSMHIRMTTNASRTVTGFNLSQQAGQVHYIYNVGSNDLVLAHQNTGSTAGNRMITNTGSDITLAAGDAAMIVYDTTTSRWRAFELGHPTSGGGGGVNAGTQYQLGYYATSGSTISGLSNLVTNASGNLTLAPTASSSGSPSLFTVTGPAHTSLAQDTEATDISFNLARNVQFTGGGGAFALQRAIRFRAPTYWATSSETIDTAILLDLDTPKAGTNMTLTASYGMRIVPAASGHNGLLIDMVTSATGKAMEFTSSGSSLGQFVAKTDRINYVLGGHSLGTSDTDGFVYIPNVAGTPAGTPTSYSGTVPIVVDSTNDKFYAYYGGAWNDLTGAGGGGSISGSATATYVAYGSGVDTITGENVFTYDAVNNILTFTKWSGAGLDLNTDTNNTAALVDGAFSVIKSSSDIRTYHGIYVVPTLNHTGSNTTVNIISVDTVNTAVTGLTTNLINLAYGGTTQFTVGSGGTITTAGSTFVSTQTTYNLLNTTSTTINFGGAATTINMAGGSGAAVVLGGGVNAAELRFKEGSGGGSNYLAFKAPATLAGDVTWTLPTADSSGTQCLASNGAGTLSWAACSGGAGSGDVVGPASATDNAIARFDTTTGKLIQNSAATLDDSGNIVADGYVYADDMYTALYSASASAGSSYFFLRHRGSAGSPAAIQSADVMGYIQWFGQEDGTVGTGRKLGGLITVSATENWSTIAHGTQFEVTAAADGTTDATSIGYVFNPTSATLRPKTTNILSLGTSSIKWSNAYINSAVDIGVSSTTTGQIVLRNSTNANTTTIQPGAAGASITFTLPTTDGNSGEYLQTNGSGVLSWATVSASLTSTYVGYGNGSNQITGENAFTYDATNNVLTFTKWSGAGLDLATDVNNTAALIDGSFSVIKSNSDIRTYHGIYVVPTLNHTGSNTTLNIISVDTVNTDTTGLTTYLMNLAYNGTMKLRIPDSGAIQQAGLAHASLGTPSNGTMIYCTDCGVTSGSDNTCAALGTGALAVRLNGVWRCFQAQN